MSQKIKNQVLNCILVIVVILLVFSVSYVLNRYDYNYFVKVETTRHGSSFQRDSNVKYGKSNSYKIESDDYNDAMFYKTIQVKPNTPYKITCMVKTDGVQTKREVSNAGANISIGDTIEKSESITGTNDWQKLTLLFQSKNREEVQVGFRLGSYQDDAKGTAWFSDFTIEAGTISTSKEWNFACFLFKNIDVRIDTNGTKQNVKLSMSSDDISIMEENIRRFEESVERLSGYQMEVDTSIYTIDDPITTISYDQKNGYYISPEDVKEVLKKYMGKKEYDHIFVAVRLGDVMKKQEIPVNDWIGLRKYGISRNGFF